MSISELEQSIRYGSALMDFEDAVERMSLTASLTCEGNVGPRWVVRLADVLGWKWEGSAPSSRDVLVRANKAIALRSAQLAERGPR